MTDTKTLLKSNATVCINCVKLYRKEHIISITIRDIAKIAGVSHSTVSRSLNDSPLISQATKNRIKAIAKEHNFEFNAIARSLSTNKTGTVGIILPDFYDEYGSSLYVGLLTTGISASLEEGGYDSIQIYPVNQYSCESNIRRVINQKKVDGLILMNADLPEEEIEFIEKSNTPFIFAHLIPNNKDKYNYVYTDHVSGGYQATEHLIKNGRSKILCLSEPAHQFEERTEGYKKCLIDNGIEFNPELIFKETCSFEFGYKVVMENPKLISRIDSIFAEADLMALGSIEALRKKGFRVPEDIAVVGYDDIELGHYFTPKLTTIHQPRDEHARIACSRLLEMIEGKSCISRLQTITIPNLVVRESCGAQQKK